MHIEYVKRDISRTMDELFSETKKMKGGAQMNFIGWMIIACEITFWLVILIGLLTRYLLRWKRISLLLFALTPLIDVILFIVTAKDVASGANATYAHAMAAVYLGLSIVYGKGMIQWADQQYVYRIQKQGAPPPKTTPSWKSSFQHLLAYAMGSFLLIITIVYIGELHRTTALVVTLSGWTLVLILDFLATRFYVQRDKQATYKEKDSSD